MVPAVVGVWGDIPDGSTVYIVNSLGLIKKHVRAYGLGAMNTQGLLKIKYPLKRWTFIEVNDFDVMDPYKIFSVDYSVTREGNEVVIVSEGRNIEFTRFRELVVRTEDEDGRFREYALSPGKIDVSGGGEQKQRVSIKDLDGTDYLVVFGVKNSGINLSSFRVDEI